MSWIPSTEIESARGTREVSLRTHHLTKRRIFLDGPITAETAQQFMEQLLYLEERQEPVTLVINSPGGEVGAGLLMYDLMQSLRPELHVFCAGTAASMAAILLAGGPKGHRYILPHSKVMIHEPMIREGMSGSASSIQTLSESILEIRDITNGILAKHTGKSLESINKATSYDHFMNAVQAVNFGICDSITDAIVSF